MSGTHDQQEARELEDVDDFTHYFNATGRLSRENSALRDELAAAEAALAEALDLVERFYETCPADAEDFLRAHGRR